MQGVRPPLSGRSAALGIVVIAFAVAWLRVGGRKDVLGVAKKTRAQVAAAGTKADSRREGHAGVQGQVARNGETAGAHKANAPGDRQSWWLPALDEENLSGREQLTKRIFTTVEVVLCLVLVGTVAVLSMSGNGLSADGLQATFAENPAASIMLVAACLQPFAAYLLRFVYRHYAQGDTGYAVSNLIALLCAEMLLQNIVGIAGMAVLLWRTWRRCSEGLGVWRAHRGIGGVLVDISGALVVLALAGICFFASTRLGA